MSDYIPEYITVQILHSLPVKSLLRFQCVCKQWKQIITSHSFAKEHLVLQKPGLIIHRPIDTMFARIRPEFRLLLPQSIHPLFDAVNAPMDLDYGKDIICLIGTLHGVVCLCINTTSQIVIWNPSIRKFFTFDLPGLKLGWRSDNIYKSYYAFWIDPSQLCYKIVIFRFLVDGDGVDGIIYSLSSGWTALPLDKVRCCRPLEDFRHTLVMIGGVAYWKVENEEDDLIILSFDFGDEGFDIIELPPHEKTVFYKINPPHHCNVQGFLSIVFWDDDFSQEHCEIYSWQEGIWANMFSLQLLTPLCLDHVLWRVEETDERREALRVIQDALVVCDANGCTSLTHYEYPVYIMTCDFVESLIFPIHSTEQIVC